MRKAAFEDCFICARLWVMKSDETFDAYGIKGERHLSCHINVSINLA